MELVLKSNNEESIARIIALAKTLNVVIERKEPITGTSKADLKDRIRNFPPGSATTFGDAAEWERSQRTDRELPF